MPKAAARITRISILPIPKNSSLQSILRRISFKERVRNCLPVLFVVQPSGGFNHRAAFLTRPSRNEQERRNRKGITSKRKRKSKIAYTDATNASE
jgi:hypothetical protein